MVCAAVPAAIFLLAILAGLSLTRLKNPTSPNADLLATLIERIDVEPSTPKSTMHTAPDNADPALPI